MFARRVEVTSAARATGRDAVHGAGRTPPGRRSRGV